MGAFWQPQYGPCGAQPASNNIFRFVAMESFEAFVLALQRGTIAIKEKHFCMRIRGSLKKQNIGE